MALTVEQRSKIGFFITVLSGMVSMFVGLLTIRSLLTIKNGGKEQ